MGDKVKVKVIAIKDGKISLSMKEAADIMAKETVEEILRSRMRESRLQLPLDPCLQISNWIK